MTIRYLHLSPADAHALLDVAGDVFDEPIVPERVRAYLADDAHIMVVAIDGATVVGQCAAVIHRHPDQATELYIDNLGVAETHRRRGIARELVARMFEIGRARGCAEAWVGTELDNDAANALYAGLGAEPVETFNLHLYKL